MYKRQDQERRNALMAALPSGAQKLITTTSVDWMKDEFAVIEMSKLVGGNETG